MSEQRYITFALGKGRLAEKTLELLEGIGITCEEMKDKKTRKLIFVNEELKLKFFLSKGPDVPTYVEYGAADIGVVGKDIIDEYKPDVYEILDLKMGKCRMCVAARKGYRDNPGRTIRVATKFSNIARSYYSSIGRDIDIIHLNGSIELAPVLGMSDVIVDIVETGTTLKENGLEVIETIMPISARVIVNKAAFEFKKKDIVKVLDSLMEQTKENG